MRQYQFKPLIGSGIQNNQQMFTAQWELVQAQGLGFKFGRYSSIIIFNRKFQFSIHYLFGPKIHSLLWIQIRSKPVLKGIKQRLGFNMHLIEKELETILRMTVDRPRNLKIILALCQALNQFERDQIDMYCKLL